jgi:hypothetical protein
MLLAAVVLSGCSAVRSALPAQTALPAEPASAAPAASVVGLWSVPYAKDREATLAEIGFGADGSFRHSGTNALGLPVNFQGRYVVGDSPQTPAIQLVYDDFPDKPVIWYYRLDKAGLTVAEDPSLLDSANAIHFQRVAQQ